jgi:glycosyltransferase involved in cell wall biosynthesis
VSIQTLLKLIKLFNSINPDVIHTHHIGPLLYAGLASKFSSAKVQIHTEHDTWHLNNDKHLRLEKMALKVAKPQLVADAKRVEESLLSHFSYENTTTINNGVDCEKFRPGSKAVARSHFCLPLDKKLIGCAGRLEYVKGHDLAIAALSYLPQSVHLVIAGQGTQRGKLEKITEQYGVSERVTFLGLVDDMQRFYQALDVFCMPSRSEGFPLAPLEAQACNVRVAVTDVGASKETLCPDSGMLIKANDIHHIVDVMSNMLCHPTESQPRNFIVKYYEIRNMVKAYECLALKALSQEALA